jgi:hypothetical protein
MPTTAYFFVLVRSRLGLEGLYWDRTSYALSHHEHASTSSKHLSRLAQCPHHEPFPVCDMHSAQSHAVRWRRIGLVA